MSSTNRGAVRNEADFYETPDYSVYSLMDVIGMNLLWFPLPWFSPCVGNGAIQKAISRWYRENEVTLNGELFEPTWDCLDIREEAEYPHETTDFLTWKNPKRSYSLIIDNPPFTPAQEIIEKCFTMQAAEPTVIMLERLNFFGSKKRAAWWDKRTPSHLAPLSERPDFTGNGGDSCDYAWFFWNYDSVVSWPLKRIHILKPWEGFDKQMRLDL